MGLVKRAVSNEEFKVAYGNSDNINIINKVISKYNKVMSADDLKSCGMYGLWRCLMYHDNNRGNKFTTSLWRFVDWECKRELKKYTTQKVRSGVVSIGNNFEVPEEERPIEESYIKEALELLTGPDKIILSEYYYDKYTMEEIGRRHKFSKETARQRINKAKKRLEVIYTGVKENGIHTRRCKV